MEQGGCFFLIREKAQSQYLGGKRLAAFVAKCHLIVLVLENSNDERRDKGGQQTAHNRKHNPEHNAPNRSLERGLRLVGQLHVACGEDDEPNDGEKEANRFHAAGQVIFR
jgi:hypothetical protein